ncbi:MAG: alanine--glyoxylate aminotransferase family protein [Burkholderiales bacterium]|nr:alanine--glyoxylate aminotransferase family protein [Burkholderiales bacterium]
MHHDSHYLSVPSIVSLDQILPEEPLLMMGAGPVPIPSRVAAANSIVINHLGETMSRVIEQVQSMCRYVFQTQSRHIMGIAGPGSAAMEMAICNLVWPGRRILSICNGYFSLRFAEMASRVGGIVTILDVDEANAADPEVVRRYLSTSQFDVITIVQGETSNTTWNSSLQEIAKIGREHGALVIVDAVCTLSTLPLQMDGWGIDCVITGGQKGLSCIPGVSLIAFSDRAWIDIECKPIKTHQWCLDALLADQFWNKKSYHYTAPVSGILALHEALRLVINETLQARFERHMLCSTSLQHSLEVMGLKLFVEKPARLNSVVGVCIPDKLDGGNIRLLMSQRHRVEIAGSFGLNIIRIGQMGEQCRPHNLFRTLHALGTSIQELGGAIDLPSGMAELERGLNSFPC